MRGERLYLFRFAPRATGSSPHARGTHHGLRPARVHGRFIPACAGNAVLAALGVGTVTVHPRMRGERMAKATGGNEPTGSSPHARGTPPNPPMRSSGNRFIPACAGNAFSQGKQPVERAVHPRMRGERIGLAYLSAALIGSSPHARGTLANVGSRDVCCRFIPACAGNAPRRRGDTRPHPVHPRMRGERSAFGIVVIDVHGSSPHARGTHRTHL